MSEYRLFRVILVTSFLGDNMSDQLDRPRDEDYESSLHRREFLRALGKWSCVVIGAVSVGPLEVLGALRNPEDLGSRSGTTGQELGTGADAPQFLAKKGGEHKGGHPKKQHKAEQKKGHEHKKEHKKDHKPGKKHETKKEHHEHERHREHHHAWSNSGRAWTNSGRAWGNTGGGWGNAGGAWANRGAGWGNTTCRVWGNGGICRVWGNGGNCRVWGNGGVPDGN